MLSSVGVDVAQLDNVPDETDSVDGNFYMLLQVMVYLIDSQVCIAAGPTVLVPAFRECRTSI